MSERKYVAYTIKYIKNDLLKYQVSNYLSTNIKMNMKVSTQYSSLLYVKQETVIQAESHLYHFIELMTLFTPLKVAIKESQQVFFLRDMPHNPKADTLLSYFL